MDVATTEELTVSTEFQSLIPPLTTEEYEQLEANIIADGCREPLTLWGDTIVDGHNRYSICIKNNIPFNTVELHFLDELAAKEWMINNQFGRRNLPNFVRAELALKLKPVIAERALKNNSLGGEGCQISDKVDTKKELAKKAGVSHDTIAKTEKILDKATEETKQQLRDGDISVNRAYSDIVSAEKKAERVTSINKQAEVNLTIKPTSKKYHVIAIDPPWNYETSKTNSYDPNGFRASCPYPGMSQSELLDMPIPAADDCVMWLWTTHKFLPDAFELLEQWGFTYKATMVWNKEKIGMGHWLRMQCEFCLLAVKGNPVWSNTTVRDIISSPRREHSRKPDEFYDMVDELCIGSKIDFFSREKREGWDQYGNDTDKFCA